MAAQTRFLPVSQFHPGQLADLLTRSYSELIYGDTPYWQEEEKKFAQFDSDAFTTPAIGKCVLFTYLEDKPIGMFSWDPRSWPAFGLIGHNCILPEYRGRGYGSAQIGEIIRVFRDNRARMLKVSTGTNPFFVPAQKVYQKHGFVEVARKPGGPDPNYLQIHYELTL